MFPTTCSQQQPVFRLVFQMRCAALHCTALRCTQAFFFYYLNKLVIQAVQKECKEDTSRAHTYAADRPARRSFH